MTGLSLTHRRAQRFADLVDASSTSSSGTPDGAPDSLGSVDIELLALVDALRAVPQARPREQFSVDLRERLMLLAPTELRPVEDSPQRAGMRQPALVPTRRPRERKIAIALTAVAIVGASSSMAVAAQGALPGDTLYPLKRVIEDAHVHLSLSDQAKGTTLLNSAGDRLDEVHQITTGGGADAGQVTDGLDTFTDQLGQGAELLMKDYRNHGDSSSIDVLRRFDSTSMRELSDLEGAVPQESEPALLAAAEKLFTIDASAGQLCPDCRTSGITEIPPTLLSSDTRTETGPSASSAPDGLDVGDAGGDGPQPTTSFSVRPSGHSSTRPTTAGSPTSGPTVGPTSVPSTSPTGHPTAVGSPSGDGSESPTSDPTISLLPTAPPSLDIPTELPTTDPGVSDVASAVATAVSELFPGLTANLVGGLPDDQGYPTGQADQP